MIAVHQPGVFGFIVENIGGGEIVVIAFLALVVLGPERIPEMARGAGRLINKVRSMSSDLTGDMADVINDPSMGPLRELGELATRPRQKLAEYALEAEAEERQRRTEKALEEATSPNVVRDDPVVPRRAEHDTADDPAAEHDTADDPAAEHDTADDPAAEHDTADDPAAEHDTADDPAAEHDRAAG
ncbi:MAG: twin-arginine translocase TatA/TatE family subunit [Microthrixaceae bacterium]|nr:twin-arginine translocase TatA/TatE family subunit [Microthrixaceae bacterium]